MSDIISVMGASAAYTSDTEFTLVKRVQLTNEVPSSSLAALLPTGLRNDFWKYFVGSTKTEHEIPTISTGGTIDTQVMKIVNGVVSSDYGPPAIAGTTYSSLDIEGVIQPELDLFLHELYRYLDHLYPDHPDYSLLLTPIELNDAFFAAAAIIGYTPDYRFLGIWSQSITGATLTQEELKWKIRDLRSAAYRRKFNGSYSGYKSIFSSMYRHGSVYATGTYIPKTIINSLDVTSKNFFRMFRLIDFLGVNDSIYKESTEAAFNGIIDPSDLYSIYEITPQLLSNDISVLSKISFGAFIADTDQILIPTASAGITVQSKSTVPYYYDSNYILHRIGLSGRGLASSRKYTITHRGVRQTDQITLSPRPFGILGSFSLPASVALKMYPKDTLAMTPIAAISFGEDTLIIDDLIQDSYVTTTGYSQADVARIIETVPGVITIFTNPASAPIITQPPATDILSFGFNIQITQYINTEITHSYVFLEGLVTYVLGTGTALSSASLKILCVPEINPITGETNNRDLFINAVGYPTIAVGNYVDICAYNIITSTWDVISNTYGWIDSIDYGSVITNEMTRFGVTLGSPATFTPDDFLPWEQRASSSFVASTNSFVNGTIPGTILSDSPTEIAVFEGNSESLRAESLTAGDSIYGPGLQVGTIVVSSTARSIIISPAAIQFGSFTYTVTMKHNTGAISSPKIFDFKKDLFTQYPTLTSSAFDFLWPSSTWPEVSQGYLEGVIDTSLYSYPAGLPSGITLPANVYIDRNVVLDLSLDRPLYHPNTLGLTGGAGQYLCLCDTPWLDYLEFFANQSKRATEQVYVGAQINLTTDTSGLYTIIPGMSYTDPAIQAKFTIIPQNYNPNPQPAYIQLGVGGELKSQLFVSIDSLIRPSIFGSAFYDQSGRDETVGETRRSTYLSKGSNVASGFANIATSLQLEAPVFETPVGEYENISGPAATDSQGFATYTSGLTDPDNPTNSYHVIHSIVYPQRFQDISINLGSGSSLIINPPAMIELQRLPAPWAYRGNWSPTPAPTSIETQPITLVPNWPSGTTYANKNYFIIQETATIGALSFIKGDWIVWDGAQWVNKIWSLQGSLKIDHSGNISLPDISALSTLAGIFPYYIVIEEGRILELGDVHIGDWVIAAEGTPSNPTWILSTGQSYDALRNTVYSDTLSASDYSEITQNIIKILGDTVFKYQLPRKFLAPGSCNLRFLIKPSYNAIDKSGAFYNFTAAGLLYDTAEESFYVQDTSLDSLLIYFQEGSSIETDFFNTVNSDGTQTQFNVKSSVEPIKHYVQFREPQYFKNLGTVIGSVSAEFPKQLSLISGFDFPISQISPTDIMISGSQIKLRNNYSSVFENTFFTHYVTLQGMLSTSDITNHTLVPVTGTGTDSTFLAEFSSAASHLTIGDQVLITEPAVARQYDATYETRYYKNLLAIAGTVSQSDPTTLLPIGNGSEDLASFAAAMNLISTGDSTYGIFILGGSSFSTGAHQLPFTGALSAACNRSAPLLWIVGGVGGQLAKSSDGSTWTPISFSTWGVGNIRKVYFTITSSGMGQWRIVGDNGKCAWSQDNGVSWFMDAIPGWGTTRINDISYMNDTWVIVGDSGKLAYLNAELAGATVWTIPSSSGFGATTIRTVSSGNNTWMTGGGDTSGPGILSISMDSGVTWNSAPMNSTTWGDNYITSILCNNEAANRTWVVAGINGRIAYSVDDGVNWASCAALPTNWSSANINNISYGYGVWTIVGDQGRIATSIDGITWVMSTAPSTLSTTNLRAAAHGASLINGIEDLIVGDSNLIAYSSSLNLSQGSRTVQGTFSGSSSISFNSDIVSWVSGDPSIKTVLITLYTKLSVECELIGIPLTRIPLFSLGDQLVLPVAVVTSSYSQANRVYYPSTDPAVHVGYPAYAEDSSLYYTDSNNQPILYVNSNNDKLYLCDVAGNYVNSVYSTLPISSFMMYSTNYGIQFNDTRQFSYTPKYPTYADWLAGSGRLILRPSVAISNIIISVSSSSIVFRDALALPSGNNILILTIMPTVITGTVTTASLPAYEFSSIPPPSVPYAINNNATGIYIPDGGYGTWIGYSSITDYLPWIEDTAAFHTNPLVNMNGTPVYLCNADGTFRTTTSGDLIPMQAPEYFTFQELITNLGREIDVGGCKGKWTPIATGSPAVPVYPDSAELSINDYFLITQTVAISTFTFTQGDWLVWDGAQWTDAPPTNPVVTKVDIANNTIYFSKSLSSTSKYLRLHMLTIASFEPMTTDLNSPLRIYSLLQTQLNKYTPDRVYYATSAYPPYSSRPDLYLNNAFINSNDAVVYYCDANGNYVDETLTTNTASPTSRYQPPMPKYKFCQDWYKEEQYLEGQENNPYWQFIIIKDVFDSDSNTWSQKATVNRKNKSATGTQLVFQEITDGSNYLTVQKGLEHTSTFTSFSVSAAPYIDYIKGIITLLIVVNPTYSRPAAEIETDFEQYGIKFISNIEMTNISSTTEIIHSLINSTLTTDYQVNTTQNFANAQDKKSSIVAITEMGVFNTDDTMIAYATFPPIIYNSAKHHLSLNLFIKQGQFSSV